MELILDSVIILLIVVMISYAIMLNIKLKNFRSAQNEMARLVNNLNEAISRTQVGVETLKETALTEEARLESLITKSRFLADELEIIIQSGSGLADRIEAGLAPGANALQNDPGAENYTDEGHFDEEMGDEEDNEMLETLKKVR